MLIDDYEILEEMKLLLEKITVVHINEGKYSIVRITSQTFLALVNDIDKLNRSIINILRLR